MPGGAWSRFWEGKGALAGSRGSPGALADIGPHAGRPHSWALIGVVLCSRDPDGGKCFHGQKPASPVPPPPADEGSTPECWRKTSLLLAESTGHEGQVGVGAWDLRGMPWLGCAWEGHGTRAQDATADCTGDRAPQRTPRARWVCTGRAGWPSDFPRWPQPPPSTSHSHKHPPTCHDHTQHACD